tara:strand:- start:12075 stop:13031 length:957 start_codon:yes stop_codon:yes gene_type:complete
MSLTVSAPKDIITPIGNQLAIFINSTTNKLSLKDIYNQTQELFSGEATFDRLVLNPEGAISNPVSSSATLLLAKTSTDNSTQINVNKKVSLSGDGGSGTLNYLALSEIESSTVFTGNSAQIVEKQSRAEFKGQGSISQLASLKGSTDLDGSLDKDVNLNYTIQSQAYLKGTGNDTIRFIVGYYCALNGSNSNAIVEDYYGYTSNDNTTGSTQITDAYTSFASFGLKNANLVVNEYIGYYHTSAQVNLATENYFMKNDVDMPLDTMGSVVSKDYKIKALNTAPNSATDTGILGEIRYTSDAVYVCIATNTWKKSELLTF